MLKRISGKSDRHNSCEDSRPRLSGGQSYWAAAVFVGDRTTASPAFYPCFAFNEFLRASMGSPAFLEPRGDLTHHRTSTDTKSPSATPPGL